MVLKSIGLRAPQQVLPRLLRGLAGGLLGLLAVVLPVAASETRLRVGDCWYADLVTVKTEFRLCITAPGFIEGVVIQRDALGPGVNEGRPVQARFEAAGGRLRIHASGMPPDWLAAPEGSGRTDGCAIRFWRRGERMGTSDCKVVAVWCRHSPRELPPLCRNEPVGDSAPAGRRAGTRP